MKFSNDSGEIASIIKSGGIALIQTDTVFGLLCLGTEVKAIEKIKAIKHRTKPSFSFFVRDTETAKQYAVLSDIQQYCFNVIFPGHFTLILEATEKTLNFLGFRICCFLFLFSFKLLLISFSKLLDLK